MNKKCFDREILRHKDETECYESTIREDAEIYADDAYIDRRIEDIEQELTFLYKHKELSEKQRKRAENLERELALFEDLELSDNYIMHMPLFGCSKERLLKGENDL